MLRPIGLALRGRLSLVRVRPWAKRAQWTDFTAPSDAMNYFRIIWRRTATALMLSTAITIAACSAKSATNQSAARPVVRMATAEASILSAFLNFPQFSVQSTAGRWRPGSRSPQVVLSTLEKNADSARDLSRPEPSRAYDRSRCAAGLPRRSRSLITAEPRPTGGVNAPPPGCYKLLQVRPCLGLLERVKRPTV